MLDIIAVQKNKGKGGSVEGEEEKDKKIKVCSDDEQRREWK